MLKIVESNLAWYFEPEIQGDTIAYKNYDGFSIRIYWRKENENMSERFTIRCYCLCNNYEKILEEKQGYRLDLHVSGSTLQIAESRARESEYPIAALLTAISQAEEAIESGKTIKL